MRELITVDESKCVGCNACVRTCPASEANVTKMLDDGRFVTTVNYDRCIACGECVRNCAHGARDYHDDCEVAMERVMKGVPLIVIAAPAIKTVFPENWKSVLMWFKEHGCAVYDVSFGADICTWAHLRAMQRGLCSRIISQPCAAIVRYIELYQSGLVKNLSPIHSPMLCLVTYLKKYQNRKESILALSPCVAKKNEFLETGLVDYNVTFKKMKKYFESHNITISADRDMANFVFPFDGEQGQVGAIYPRPGGLRDNLWLHDPNLNITTAEGVHKVYPELDMYAKLIDDMKPEVFDVLSCEYGCNVGPGTLGDKTVFDAMHTMRRAEASAKSMRKTTGMLFFRGAEDKLFKRFDDMLHLTDFIRTYDASNSVQTVSDAELEETFNSMGKHTEEERHYDCHACGYKSCHDMAVAIYKGLNVPQNCIVNAKRILSEQFLAMQESHGALVDVTGECKTLSNQLVNDVENILLNVASISGSTQNVAVLSGKVKELIDKLINICNNVDHMDAEHLKGLAILLGNTNVAFSELAQSVDMSVQDCEIIKSRTDEIRELVDRINETLSDTVDENAETYAKSGSLPMSMMLSQMQ